MITLVELLLSCVATDNGVAVPVDAISEVLTGHADHAALPTLEFLVVDESPFLHNSPKQYMRTTADGTAWAFLLAAFLLIYSNFIPTPQNP